MQNGHRPDLNPLDRLTDSQREVLALLAARVTIKEIAGRLGVTNSAVNQRIKKLKDRLAVTNMRDLAAVYHLHAVPPAVPTLPLEAQGSEDSCTKSAAIKSHLDPAVRMQQPCFSDETQTLLEFSDAQTFPVEAPWEFLASPQIVPEFLNGQDAAWRRTGLALGLVVLMFMAIIVALTAKQTLSEVLLG